MRTIRRNIVGAFIFSSDNKLLLGKNAPGGVYQGVWTIPGGIDDGENPQQAIIREVAEETGLDVSDAVIEAVGYPHSGASEKTLRTGERVAVEMVFQDFVIRLHDEARSTSIIAQDDFASAEWFDLADLKDLTLATGVKATLRHLGYI